MSRRVVMAVLVILALALGGGLGWLTMSRGGSPADAGPTTASPTSSPTPTLSTESPSTSSPSPSPSPTTVSPEQAADELAGVRVRRVPDTSSGELRIVPGGKDAPGNADTVMTVRVEVEEGLDIDDDAFAAFVMDTLNDPRGWGADGSVAFARTEGDADIRVVLATPGTVDEMCAPLATHGKWSCGRYGHAAINADRWVFGADAWDEAGGDITEYRHYVVNHEVGHLLGHPHERCPGAGQTAPVMVQQSISVGGCVPNGWPSP